MKNSRKSRQSPTCSTRGALDRRQALGIIAGSATALSAGIPTLGYAATGDTASGILDQHPNRGKITLEEHFSFPGAADVVMRPPISEAHWRDIEHRLEDVEEFRLPLMDKHGVAMQIVSLTANGIEGQPDKKKAIDLARATNDWVVEKFTSSHPTRFGGFAAVPLQDPVAAAHEVERAIRTLGLNGVLVNGYVNVGDTGTGEYLDHPMFTPFWEMTSGLDVPVYLHPRNPLQNQQRIYRDYEMLLGANWAFGVETATHALRLIVSGLFDRFPRQQVILGHMGEGLISMMTRTERKLAGVTGRKALMRPITDYIRQNFHVTTSGYFHIPVLENVISEIGIDRVLFSIDYPYEDMETATNWLNEVPVTLNDKAKLSHLNAERLFKL